MFKKSNIHAAAGVLLLLAASGAPALAGSGKSCASRNTVAQTLQQRFGETVRYVGSTKSNYTVEVFASDNFGTWTLTVAREGGPTCLVSSGKGYKTVASQVAGL